MLAAAAGFAYTLETPLRRIHLPGPTSNGHYQIELACGECHTEAFGDRESMQAACVRCHGAELAESHDSHPELKFTDPRNLERTAVLDARYCVTCHREHQPELTAKMGVTLPTDFCEGCHASIADERPSHVGLGFDTCADTGCHKFHDNRALYEDFLGKHLNEPDVLPEPRVLARTTKPAARPLTLADADAREGVELARAEREAWAKSAHARGGANCSSCHEPAGGGAFEVKVPDERCGGCHERELADFEKSRHGMRHAAELSPMRVGDARTPMAAEAAERTVGCTSCHGAHAFDTRFAAVEACTGCHDDRHTRSYEGSAHARLFRDDPSGAHGVSCATCHLPRVLEAERTRVVHNQNHNLRPNEKMVRDVCTSCHGLGFTLDALADEASILENFDGRPKAHVKSLEMVEARAER